MAEGKGGYEWEQTAALMALVANCHRDAKKRPAPFRPDEFNPHAGRNRKPKGPAPKVPLSVLKSVFVKG